MTQPESMTLDSILSWVTSIQNTPGKNDKRSLLLDLTNTDSSAKLILQLALNPRTPMYMGEEASLSKMQSIDSTKILSTSEQAEALEMTLQDLMKGLSTESIPRGHKALAMVKVFLEEQCSTIQEQELCLSLIQKNPRLGVSWHSFTKVTGAPKFEVMLAKDINKIKKMDEKVRFPVYIQPKLDGYRAIAKTNADDEWELFSRNGKKYENFPTIIAELEEHGDTESVYDGEIMSDDFQAMQRTAFTTKKKGTVGDVRYYIFDILQDNEFARKACYRTFYLRKQELDAWHDHAWEHGTRSLVKVATASCESWEEVYAAHERYKEAGYEGTIVRLNKCYEFKRTDSLMKIKDMLSQDCYINQVVKGKGRNQNVMGAIKVLQDDGQTVCEVGTGFTDKMREDFWTDRQALLHKMVEVKYQELTPDGVMRFPVFMRFRDDKDEPKEIINEVSIPMRCNGEYL